MTLLLKNQSITPVEKMQTLSYLWESNTLWKCNGNATSKSEYFLEYWDIILQMIKIDDVDMLIKCNKSFWSTLNNNNCLIVYEILKISMLRLHKLLGQQNDDKYKFDSLLGRSINGTKFYLKHITENQLLKLMDARKLKGNNGNVLETQPNI